MVWFAKLENYRYYTHNDPEVKQGIKKRGERKEGEQMHVQVIVSRKDAINKIKLSPMNTSRGKNEDHSKKMGQFDRVAFKQCGETLFDELFEFDRQLKDTMAYANAQKNGSLAERVQMESRNQSEEATHSGTGLSEDKPDMELTPDIHSHSIIDKSFEGFINHVRIDIKDDVDDEAIHGRNRHRKRQARTNTR